MLRRNTEMEESIGEHVVVQSSCASSKHHKRSSSIVWDNLEKLPLDVEGKQKARCKLCMNHITDYVADTMFGTSNMLRHIISCHKGEMDECTSQCSRPLNQDKYREMMLMTIIKHNYPFSFVEHERNCKSSSFFEPRCKTRY